MRYTFGTVSIILGTVTLAAAAAHLLAGPFAPQPATGTSLGVLASDFINGATRGALGQPQPEPLPQVWTLDRIIAVMVPVVAVLGLLCAVVSYVRHEAPRVTAAGAMLCVSALGFQLFAFYMAMLIMGLILMMLIYALRDVLGGIFS